jgi:hypothetical protein
VAAGDGLSAADVFADLLEAAMLDDADRLLGDVHDLGDALVGKLAVEQQLDDLQVAKSQRPLEIVDQIVDGLGQQGSLNVVLLIGASVPTGRLDRALHLLERVGGILV